ncbi:MAG: cytidylyltransferase domain-containing protein [Arachnia sp.]
MRTRVVIQSRLSSSRLPGKALMTMAGMPLIELVARRAARSGLEVVVATSVEPYDELIAAHLSRVGIPVLQGALDDVLGRFAEATADLEPTDRVVRLTGDNPVADATLVEQFIEAMSATEYEYGLVPTDRVPEGLGCEVFPVSALRAAHAQATAAYDREHVTPWIRREFGEFHFIPPVPFGDINAFRCTTDCLNDYHRVSQLFAGVADPVGIGYEALFAQLGRVVAAQGAEAVPVARSGSRLTSVLLGAHDLGATGSERDLSVVRDGFAHAANSGVSHVFADAEAAGVVAAGTLPALRQRLGAMLVLPTLTGQVRAGLEVVAEVERACAVLGSRRLAAVMLRGPEQCAVDGGAAWDQLLSFQRELLVEDIGLLFDSPEAVTTEGIQGLSVVACRIGSETADLSALRQCRRPGLTVVGVLAGSDPASVRRLLDSGAVDCVVVSPSSTQQLRQCLLAGREAHAG